MRTKIPLNKGQKAAAKGFFEFLMQDDQKELVIAGAGGVGKTFLMGHFINETMPQYHQTCELLGLAPKYTNVQMTATTNKAAEVLSHATGMEVPTIHSFLGLKVTEDFSSGTTRITKTSNWTVHNELILFIDEAPMIDSHLLRYIREGTHNCKVVYVGDREQLSPVTEKISRIYEDGLPTFELTEPMRNCGQPALMDLCSQLRDTVKTQEFQPIKLVPGVIDLLDDEQMAQEIQTHFMSQQHNNRILAYTNKRVIDYNDYIRDMRQLDSEYHVGERLIMGSALQLKEGIVSVEDEVQILELSRKKEILDLPFDGQLEYRMARIRSTYMEFWAKLPVDRDHYFSLIKFYQKKKAWLPYFQLKNNIPDLRPREASTVHKAQGSTYDTVFIDADNLSTCHQPYLAARLLYVAVTRAKSRIVFYGSLAKKYGGFIE